jgi:hypothetical protein
MLAEFLHSSRLRHFLEGGPEWTKVGVPVHLSSRKLEPVT